MACKCQGFCTKENCYNKVVSLEQLASELKTETKSIDMINHPPHYTQGKIEVLDFITDQNLGFHAGNIIKYICRENMKGGLDDLKKAKFYLERLIELREEK
jgi:hypothetical protein